MPIESIILDCVFIAPTLPFLLWVSNFINKHLLHADYLKVNGFQICFFQASIEIPCEPELSCSGLLCLVLRFWCCGFGASLDLTFQSYGGCSKSVSVMYALYTIKALSSLAAVGLGLLPLASALIGSQEQKSRGLIDVGLGLSAAKAKMNVISERCFSF